MEASLSHAYPSGHRITPTLKICQKVHKIVAMNERAVPARWCACFHQSGTGVGGGSLQCFVPS